MAKLEVDAGWDLSAVHERLATGRDEEVLGLLSLPAKLARGVLQGDPTGNPLIDVPILRSGSFDAELIAMYAALNDRLKHNIGGNAVLKVVEAQKEKPLYSSDWHWRENVQEQKTIYRQGRITGDAVVGRAMRHQFDCEVLLLPTAGYEKLKVEGWETPKKAQKKEGPLPLVDFKHDFEGGEASSALLKRLKSPFPHRMTQRSDRVSQRMMTASLWMGDITTDQVRDSKNPEEEFAELLVSSPAEA